MRLATVIGVILTLALPGAASFARGRQVAPDRTATHGSARTEIDEGAARSLPLAPQERGEKEELLLSRLEAAKREADSKAAAVIEKELAALRGVPSEFVSEIPAELGLRVRRELDDAGAAKTSWTDDDILVAGMGLSEVRPSMASDRSGNLYVALEYHGSSGTWIRIYKSENGGMYWDLWFQISALQDLTKPSIAVGEGGEDRLLLVCQYGASYVFLVRVDLGDPALYDTEIIEYNPIGVSNPRIATDAAEWAGWYPYVVWNSLGVDNWVLRFSRSLDYGVTWQTPVTLAGYCGYPDEFYDGSEGSPDIDYGGRRLYTAFDNYSPPCTSVKRDAFAMQSSDYGATWGPVVRLTSETDDEYDPRVAAVKNYLDEPTAVVAYTRFWHDIDRDIMYHGTEDGGASWSTHLCMSCVPDTDEICPDLEASLVQGRIHAAWWEEGDIYYRSAPYATPLAWGDILTVSDAGAADVAFPRPAVGVIPTASPSNEAGIAWADSRRPATADDIFYDGASGNPTAVAEGDGVPSVGLLDPIHPNPFNPAAILRYRLSSPGAVLLTVHDVTGRRIAVLADGPSEAGAFETIWNGMDDSGRAAPSGVYFARLRAGEETATRRMVLVR